MTPALSGAQAILAALALLASPLLGSAPLAAQDCAELRASFAVAEPPADGGIPASALAWLEDEVVPGCTAAETAMFHANYGAAARAEPPASVDQLYGTWLGDDVLLYVAGIVVPGQEVGRPRATRTAR